MRNPFELIAWAIAFSLFLQTKASSVTTATLRRADDATGNDRDNRLLASDISHDEQAAISFSEDEMPQYQHDLLHGAYIDNEHLFLEAMVGVQDHGRALHKKKGKKEKCVTEQSSADYFEIKIHMITEDEPFDCKVADTIMLGHDINRMLWDYGVGAQEDFDNNIIFLAGVCPKPTTPPSVADRRALYRLLPTKFVYAGLGACRYCSYDNQDRRDLATMEWFNAVFKPELERTLTKAIHDELVPAYEGCLGSKPDINVDVTGTDVSKLNAVCGNDKDKSTATDEIAFLESYNLGDVLLNPILQTNCSKCINLDWNTRPDGTLLEPGLYVKRQFQDAYGVKVTAHPNGELGYAPNNTARVFNTSNPVAYKDYELASPHKSCAGGKEEKGKRKGGKGRGGGGRVGSPGVNCVPVGNALIIQERDIDDAVSNKDGGKIKFTFFKPVTVSDIGLMDFGLVDHKITIKFWDGLTENYSFKGFGNNSVQRVVTSKQNVKALEVFLPGIAAVTEINFCPPCTDAHESGDGQVVSPGDNPKSLDENKKSPNGNKKSPNGNRKSPDGNKKSPGEDNGEE